MSASRAAHSATLLADGRVLIVGGCTLASCELDEAGATAELFDPLSGAFTPAGRLARPRVGHIALRLGDGSVLIVGGWTRGRTVPEIERYDVASGQFQSAGALLTARGAPTATLLRDGTVLITGGMAEREMLASAERYDPGTGRSTALPEMAEPRSAHSATLLPDGRVLLAGGGRERGQVLASAELFEPEVGRFVSTGSLASARHKHAAAPLADGGVLIVGGSDARDFAGRYASAERYDVASGRFRPLAAMGAARFKIPDATASLPTGEVLIGGGDATVELFDPASDAFRLAGGSMDRAWMFATATLLGDGTVLITGGYDQRIAPTASTWLYRRQG